MKMWGGGGTLLSKAFGTLTSELQCDLTVKMIRAKKLNHQRGVTVQIALQISEYCIALACATVNEA